MNEKGNKTNYQRKTKVKTKKEKEKGGVRTASPHTPSTSTVDVGEVGKRGGGLAARYKCPSLFLASRQVSQEFQRLQGDGGEDAPLPDTVAVSTFGVNLHGE